MTLPDITVQLLERASEAFSLLFGTRPTTKAALEYAISLLYTYFKAHGKIPELPQWLTKTPSIEPRQVAISAPARMKLEAIAEATHTPLALVATTAAALLLTTLEKLHQTTTEA